MEGEQTISPFESTVTARGTPSPMREGRSIGGRQDGGVTALEGGASPASSWLFS